MNRKFEEYLNSPYKMLGITERMYTTKTGETLTVDPETGQYYTIRKVSKNTSSPHDDLVYTKMFQSGISQLMDMPHQALKILMYAMSTVKPLSQTVILNPPDVIEFCKMANGTYYNNLYVLLERKTLSRKLGSSIEYWFDPNMFFNGNRIRVSGKYNNSSLNLADEVRRTP